MNTSIPSRLLAVDVGNSRIKFGLFDLATVPGFPELIESMAVAPGGPVPWVDGGWPGEFEICSSSIVAASTRTCATVWAPVWAPRLVQAVRAG
ncbi:MAG: hypothetical protein CM1200mP2_04910 [Planctomycetaceae bacterium]|nr:MAG: hypothetical protein CM1200mP2_04910 [Planctomycetaceae bacterium]